VVVNPLWIKICGITTRPSAEVAARAGADAVGFVFFEGSPRNLSVEDARGLQAAVPAAMDRVAVFLHPAQALVDAVIAAIEPDWIQADAGDLERLRLPPRQRALPVYRGLPSPPSPMPRRCLLESAHSGVGERGDWNAAARLTSLTQLVLAGGLDQHNVAEAVRAVRPFGVDVSSGVESSRGVKDAVRIHEFVRAARAAGAPGHVEEYRR
jgi:phosphoribosylanthranilate isomerase